MVLEPDEFELVSRARAGHEVAEEGDLLIALDTALTPELEAEGLAREVAHRLQGLRKAAGYEISDRIVASVGGDAGLVGRLEAHRAWLAAELLASELHLDADAALNDADASEEAQLAGARVRLAVRRA